MSTRETVVQSVVSIVEKGLRKAPWLYRTASRTLYAVDPSYYTLSPGLPQAVEKAMLELKAKGLLDEGDYFEFGVFRGYALGRAQKTAEHLGANQMHFHGFDSFQGLPKIQPGEADGSMFFEGQFACSLAFVESCLKKNGNDMKKITLTKGFFSDTLTPGLKSTLRKPRAVIAVVDCDLYSSTVPVLAWLDDLVGPGSIIMMDDWNSFGGDPGKGQQLAFGEWLGRRTDLVAEPMFDFETHGRAFRLAAKATARLS